jgi:hypothetical protein
MALELLATISLEKQLQKKKIFKVDIPPSWKIVAIKLTF